MEGTEQEQTKPSLEQQVAAWSAERAEIVALAATAEGISIAGHADGPKAGREVVHNTLMPIWRRRCAIDNREKELLEIPKKITEQIKRTAADLAAPLLAAEDRLRKDRDAYDAEQTRIAKEAADAKRAETESRLATMAKYGIAPNIVLADSATADEWAAQVAGWEEDAQIRRAAESLAATLTALGDPCDWTEALHLTEEQTKHRVAVAQKADHDRKEAARIKAEEEAAAEAKKAEDDRLERVRLERVAMRVRELSELGIFEPFEAVEAMSDEVYSAALTRAVEAREQKEQEERDRKDALRLQQKRFERGAERFRILSRLGANDFEPDQLADIDAEAFAAIEQVATDKKAARDAETARLLQEEQARQESARKAKEAAAEQKRQDDARLERERQEALRPQREAVAAWAQAALDAMPSTPAVDDPDILDTMRQHVESARLALLDLRDRMSDERTGGEG